MSRKTTPRKRRTVHDNPVARAVAKKAMADALTEMHRHLTRISVKAYLTEDGEVAPALLGDLALMLGIGAEIGLNREPHTPETRRMHAALRTVLHMSTNGRRWQAAQARVLHEAAALAAQAFETHPAVGVARLPSASELAEAVRLGTARMNAVAGPEIYNAQAVAGKPHVFSLNPPQEPSCNFTSPTPRSI